MLDPAKIPPVASNELLARYIFHSRQVRSSDRTVKPDAFIPHPRSELSVTRHREATEEEIWSEGERVAAIRALTLHGRADVLAQVMEAERLSVVAKPIGENPNHADVVGWPTDKPEQKIKALEIASKSQFVPRSP